MSASLAAISASAPDKVYLVSRVGDDALGRQAREQMSAHRVRADFISTDPRNATGTVTVTLPMDGSPVYCIQQPAAWDAIPATPELTALAPMLDALCFGTLAQRSTVTRRTLRRFVESTRPDCVRVFDINLRAPWWTQEMLPWGCARATILKMNHEEVPQLAQALGVPLRAPVEFANFVLREFPIRLIAITRGANGSLLATHEGIAEHPGIAVKVVDSIGAGDAFTAALVHDFLRGSSLAAMNETANHWGAWVASQRGGMPQILDVLRGEWKGEPETFHFPASRLRSG
jgi:fructokinase